MRSLPFALLLLLLPGLLTCRHGPAIDGTAARPRFRTVKDPVAGQYIVVLRDQRLRAEALDVAVEGLLGRYGGEKLFVYRASPGFAVRKLSDASARRLADHELVDYVEQDARVHPTGNRGIQVSDLPWGLDRIDQRGIDLDTK